MARIPILLAGILVLAAFIAFLLAASFQIGLSRKMEQVFLAASDGVTIAGDYYPAKGERGVLLLHMMPATKESWRDFALQLNARGRDVLAIDLRGHGKSDGGPEGYLAFSNEEHQKGVLDVEAGVAFLEARGISRSEIALVGASIGANLALEYLTQNPNVATAVLLSPGLDYRGIRAEPLMRATKPGMRILLAASANDPQSNEAVLKAIAAAAPSGVETKSVLSRGAGHGTDMLAPYRAVGSDTGFGKETPDLAEEILNWLQ